MAPGTFLPWALVKLPPVLILACYGVFLGWEGAHTGVTLVTRAFTYLVASATEAPLSWCSPYHDQSTLFFSAVMTHSYLLGPLQ